MRQYRKTHKYNKSKHLRRIRRWLRDYKVAHGCTHCGETHPAVLQFHHLDPAKKDFNLSQAGSHYGLERVIEEVKKCSVLCANCHLIEHWRLRGQDDERGVEQW